MIFRELRSNYCLIIKLWIDILFLWINILFCRDFLHFDFYIVNIIPEKKQILL